MERLGVGVGSGFKLRGIGVACASTGEQGELVSQISRVSGTRPDPGHTVLRTIPPESPLTHRPARTDW